MKKSTFVIFTILLFSACSENDSSQNNGIQSNDIEKSEAESQSNETRATDAKSISFLIQGTWQSDEDPTNKLKFDANNRMEIAGGMSEWDSEEYIVSENCEGNENLTSLDEGYIVCPISEMCWYVNSLDSKKLSLTYVSRGNTLTYTRIK